MYYESESKVQSETKSKIKNENENESESETDRESECGHMAYLQKPLWSHVLKLFLFTASDNSSRKLNKHHQDILLKRRSLYQGRTWTLSFLKLKINWK